MTRIIAGDVGSLRLKAAASTTRPTSDRVKESIFSKLTALDLLSGARVLDVYAGTGALGLEAVSRGAEFALFIEKNQAAYKVLQENCKLVGNALLKQGIERAIRYECADASRYLGKQIGLRFDLIFVDPPYDLDNKSLETVLESCKGYLSEYGLLILERSSKSEQPNLKSFTSSDLKTYGDTSVWFLSKN